MKNWFLVFISALLLLVACRKQFVPYASLTAKTTSFVQASKPNVVLILADDVGFENMHITGGQSYLTPNLDALALSGINFINNYATPLCSPSRVLMMTGKYNNRNYVGWGDLERSNKTIGNLMHSAGYATGVFGKWQHGGGDTSFAAFEFDEAFVHDAFDASRRGNRYKSPHLYSYKNGVGAFVPDSVYTGKYGEDVIRDSLFSFMQRNAATGTPFFAYYPMVNCHPPFQPTPDDPEYADFHAGNISDTNYYASMMKYMDKVVGQVVAKLDSLGIAENTIIMFTADNGTPAQKVSVWFNSVTGQYEWIVGGKHHTNKYGSHTPLYVAWKGHIVPHTDSSLIDFSDYMVTLADIAGISVPSSYGIIDGVSFYDNILGISGANRTWSYCYFNPLPVDSTDDEGSGDKVSSPKAWVFDLQYKKYDTSKASKFYDYIANPLEGTTSIRPKDMTPTQKSRDSLFQSILSSMIH